MPTTYDEKNDFEILFNMSMDMLCIAGTDGFLKKINPSFGRVLGYSDEELLSKPFFDFVHPDDIEATLIEVEKLKEGISTIKFENRYRHADGHYRIFSWSAYSDPNRERLYSVARDVTEERETQSNLLQLQRALNTEAIVAKTDSAGTITEVNDKFCEISGYSKDELIGKNHRIINSGKHTKEFFRDLWNTISSGKSWSGMIENRKKNGEHYFVQSIITPLVEINGTISSYQAIRFDATELIQVKDELNKTLDILNETGSIAHVGGWELDIETSQLTWTDETFKILEVEKNHDQRPVLPEGLDLFTPDSKPVIERAVQRAIEFGEPYSLELEALTAKGNVVWVYTSGKANYKDGKIVSLSGTIQDINTRKLAEINHGMEQLKAEKALRIADERFRAAFYSSRGIETITDIKTGCYINVNDTWLATWGYERSEVIGKTANELNIWGGDAQRQEILDTLKAEGQLNNYEATVSIKNGEKRDIIFNAVTISVSGEELLFISGSDVTEQKHLEEKLRQSQRLEAVGQLTGGIAHDFNNLMAIMMGNLEAAMIKAKADAPLRNNINEALKAIDRGAALTQQLLSFSRQQVLSPVVVDINELVDGNLAFLKRTLGENIQIVTKYADVEISVKIDEAIFGNAFVNLSINARDAMSDGGTLTVRTASVEFTGETLGLDAEPAYGSYVLITISDTGSGISPGDLDQVLEPFFTTKEVGEGSGLGLSMVYGFVTQSNGFMDITSKKGEGTIVSLYFPIVDDLPLEKNNEGVFSPEVHIDKTILLVEDDQQVRRTTTATLEDIGYTVIEAEDGPTALEILAQRSGNINFVLTDVVMPNNMSGIDLAKQIAADYKHIKLLLTSGYPDKIADENDIKALGIKLLAKPFRRAQLATAIEGAASDQTEY